MDCDGSNAMNVTNPDDAGWGRERVADVPVQFFPPRHGATGVVVVLPDPDWPDPIQWLTLVHLARATHLGVVVPNVWPWWIDRPDPALKPARSPLAFVIDELAPWIRSKWADSRLAALGVGFA